MKSTLKWLNLHYKSSYEVEQPNLNANWLVCDKRRTCYSHDGCISLLFIWLPAEELCFLFKSRWPKASVRIWALLSANGSTANYSLDDVMWVLSTLTCYFVMLILCNWNTKSFSPHKCCTINIWVQRCVILEQCLEPFLPPVHKNSFDRN